MLRIKREHSYRFSGWCLVTPDDAVLMEGLPSHARTNKHDFYYFSVSAGKFKSLGECHITHQFVPDNFLLKPHQIDFYNHWRDRIRVETLSYSYDYTEIYWGKWVVSTGRIQYQGEDIQPVSPFTVVSYGDSKSPQCRFEETGTRCDIACLIAVSMAVNGGHLVY